MNRPSNKPRKKHSLTGGGNTPVLSLNGIGTYASLSPACRHPIWQKSTAVNYCDVKKTTNVTVHSATNRTAATPSRARAMFTTYEHSTARQSVRAKLHCTDTGYTNTTNEHHQRSKICHIPTSWHVEMLGSGIAMWQICCRIIVVSLSVGAVRSRCPCSGVWLLLKLQRLMSRESVSESADLSAQPHTLPTSHKTDKLPDIDILSIDMTNPSTV